MPHLQDGKKPFSIGGVYYDTLADALSAAQDGQTILMGSDYLLGNVGGVQIAKSITLDLGGHTLGIDCGNDCIHITGTDVTIQNGTVRNGFDAMSVAAIHVEAGARLTVSNATLQGGDTYFGGHGDGLTIEGEAVVLSGDVRDITVFSGGRLTMSGGKAGELGLDPDYGTVQLSGGEFSGFSRNVTTAAEFQSLLARYHAFAAADGTLIQLAAMTGSTAAKVVACTHPKGIPKNEACPYCGNTCAHMDSRSDIPTVDENGVCTTCGKQVRVAAVNGNLYETL